MPAPPTFSVTSSGYRAFLSTQFLGAFNDNALKLVVAMSALAAASGTGAAELSWVGAVFILPFLLFSGYAGQLADRYSKRSLLVALKAVELAVVLAGAAALLTGRFEGLLAVLFLMASRAAFFSPAKYGIVPELVTDASLSRANGVLEMSTFLAILLGSAAGGLAYAWWGDAPMTIGVALVLVAVLGLWVSWRIPVVSPARPHARLRPEPWAGLGAGLERLHADRPLALSAVGIAAFWFLGSLVQMLVLIVGSRSMRLDDMQVAMLSAALAVGVGAGSLVAGRVSGRKVELGLAPVGAFLIALALLALGAATQSYGATWAVLAVLGMGGGLFAVPLHAFVQQRTPVAARGQVLGVINLVGTVGIILASAALWFLDTRLGVTPERTVLALGVVTFAASLYVLALVPEFFIRLVLWTLTHSVYRIKVVGDEHVPFRGPALLVCNHLSHVDGFIVGASVQRMVRFMMYRPYYEFPLFKPLLQRMHAIPVSSGSRHEIVASLERAREELAAGHVVCIFAEGAISRTGNLLPFKRGFERIVEGLDVPVIPVCLDRLWGSVFSFKDGRFFWKWPERIPYPVTVTFGKPLPATTTAREARQAVMELASDAMIHRVGRHDLLHERFIRAARRHWGTLAMAEAGGRELTFGRVLTAVALLSRWIRQHVPASPPPADTAVPDGCVVRPMVGLMLPASIGGALANVAVLVAGRVPVNLNFTAGRESIAAAVEQCGIRTVLTSRQFLAKAKIEPFEGMFFLEDVLPAFSAGEKALAFLACRLLPQAWLRRLYAPEPVHADDLATVIFSSGSTGKPKGVMLSHRNVLSNLEGMAQLFWVTRDDRILGVLPFFHSFGFTGTLWFPLVSGFAALYVPNPLDAKTVGELAGKYGATMAIGTPTFYTAYIRKCTPEEFARLRYGIVGAEKLRDPIAKAFREKYGIELIEGYGCTETSPVISCNMPAAPKGQVSAKAGTVGHPLPGVVVRAVDPDTHAPVAPGEQGLLLVKGPNRMLGYLGNAPLTSEVVRHGWYVTGDIASVDDDGFIRLTDRLSRFSKIAGEMVPHLKIEEVASGVLDDANCVVTSVPDEDRGERLVLFYTKKDVAPERLWAGLNESELPKLWVPKRENIHVVDAIPVLGTGKIDLKRVKAMALAAGGATV